MFMQSCMSAAAAAATAAAAAGAAAAATAAGASAEISKANTPTSSKWYRYTMCSVKS